MRGLAVNQFVEVDERLLKNWSRCEAKPFGPQQSGREGNKPADCTCFYPCSG